MCLPFDSRQYASAFDQPLSFDTSKVTTMYQMFVHASAFNQPLSFDTSSVTDMRYMFYVRSSRALLPICRALPCTLRAPPLRAIYRLPPLAPHRMPSVRLGSTRQRSTSR